MCYVVHEDSDFESDDEDEHDEHPRYGEGKRSLTTRQVMLASVVGPSHVSLGAISDLPAGFRASFLTVGGAKLQMKN